MSAFNISCVSEMSSCTFRLHLSLFISKSEISTETNVHFRSIWQHCPFPLKTWQLKSNFFFFLNNISAKMNQTKDLWQKFEQYYSRAKPYKHSSCRDYSCMIYVAWVLMTLFLVDLNTVKYVHRSDTVHTLYTYIKYVYIWYL